MYNIRLLLVTLYIISDYVPSEANISLTCSARRKEGLESDIFASDGTLTEPLSN